MRAWTSGYPQSWNRYMYLRRRNPIAESDPGGLDEGRLREMTAAGTLGARRGNCVFLVGAKAVAIATEAGVRFTQTRSWRVPRLQGFGNLD